MEDTENLEPIEDQEDATPVEESSEEVIEESDHDDGDDEGEEEEGGDEGEEAETSAPEYEPNYSFRAGEENYEMDDWLKSKIENADDEARFRDLSERAHGLEVLKQQRAQSRDHVSQLEHVESQRQQAVGQMRDLVKNNEWEPFQREWQISDDQVLNRAVQIMQVREMPQQEQQAYYGNVQAREQNAHLQQQNQHLQNQHSHMAMNQRSWELEQTLQHDQFSNSAQSFDERAGRQGAFREEIIKRGQYYAQVQGRDVPPQVLAQELMAYVPQQVEQGQQQPQGQHQVVTQRKPTLPNVRGNSSSPVKGTYNSIADIRAKAEEFALG